MTAIAVVKKDGKVSIASDSMGSNGSVTHNYGTKLVKGSNFVIGVSGSYRVTDILRDNVEDFKAPKTWTRKEARRFAEWFRKTMIEYGSKKEAEAAEILKHPIWLVMATKSKIFRIQTDYSVVEHRTRDATGAGAQIVEGAMHALYDTKLNSSDIVREAIRAACDLSPHCGKPIHVEDL